MPDVAIIPSGGTDRWGDPLEPGDPIVVRRVTTYPRYSEETNQNSVITGITAIFPPRTEVPEAIDSVVVDIEVADDGTMVPGTGRRYEVIGDPGVWEYLDGTGAGTEVALTRWSG